MGCAMEYAIARRTPRYQFVADVELNALSMVIRFVARTNTLGRFGCGIDTSLSIPRGTKIKVKLFHRGAEIKAFAQVVYSGLDCGMGIEFTSVGREDERILESWIEELENMPIQK